MLTLLNKIQCQPLGDTAGIQGPLQNNKSLGCEEVMRSWAGKCIYFRTRHPGLKIIGISGQKVLRVKLADAGRQGRNSSRWEQSAQPEGQGFRQQQLGCEDEVGLEWILYQLLTKLQERVELKNSPGTGRWSGCTCSREERFTKRGPQGHCNKMKCIQNTNTWKGIWMRTNRNEVEKQLNFNDQKLQM